MAAPTVIPKSVYYDGSVTEVERANGMGGVPDFTVYGPDQLRLSAHPTIPFALVVSKGRASAFGVTAYVETAQGGNLTVQCDPNTTGTRWDIVTLRYDWRQNLGGPTDIRAFNAGGKQIPANLEMRPGTLVDQPLWLVRWTGNSSAPAEYVDLRCFAANGGMMANDRLSLRYLAKVGARVNIGLTTWTYAPIGNGQFDWVSPIVSYPPITPPNGYSTEGSVVVERVAEGVKRVTVDVGIRRTGSNLGVGTNFTGLGQVIPNDGVGDSPEKFMAAGWSGGGAQNVLGMIFVNPRNGHVGFRGQQPFTWVTGAKFSVNCTYYV